MESIKIIRVRGTDKEIVEDLITEEAALKLVVGYEKIVTLLCSPQNLEDLIRGFLWTSGLIEKGEDIKKIVINRATWIAYIHLADEHELDLSAFSRMIGSGCGSSGIILNDLSLRKKIETPDDFRVDPLFIKDLMKDFKNRSVIHDQTGGVHGAALADKVGIVVYREDIGRHNAIDKVIGHYLTESGSFQDKILVTSGRISSEVLARLHRCGIPMLISRSAPTARSVMLARETGITLIGFARGERMNIYSAEERIAL